MEQNTEQKAKPSTHAQYIGVLIIITDIVIFQQQVPSWNESSSSPATNNAIRGVEQEGDIAKQWFC